MLRKVEVKISVVDMGYTTVISEYKFMATFHDFRPCAGDIIGQSGNSGNASNDGCAGPHLHYQVQIWRNDSTVYLNPEDYIYSILDDDGKQTNPCN